MHNISESKRFRSSCPTGSL